ncbi:sporulation-induced protein [Umbelopsis sp. WA50703]
MFWRFGFNNPSAIDAILDKEDVDLQEILNEGDVIQEVKTHNQRLIDFLCQREKLAQLLSYVTAESLDREQWSYPLIASEILSSDIPQILDSLLIDHVELLKDLWDFLDKPSMKAETSMPSDLAANFAKVNCSLLAKRSEAMLAFVQSLPNVFQKIVNHLETPAITDLLLTLIRMEEVLPEDNSSIEWLNEQGLLDKLISKLDPNLDADDHSIAQQVISEIIRMSQTSIPESPSIGSNVLINSLKSRETMTKLVDYMLDKKAHNSTSSLINGVAIIIDLIRHNNSDAELDHIDLYAGEEGIMEPPVSLKEMMEVLADRVGDFNNLLIHPKSVSSTIPTTIGDRMPLGFERLKICELFAELLHCSNMAHLNKPVNKSQESKTNYISTFENSKSPMEEEEEEQKLDASSKDKKTDDASKDDAAAAIDQEPKQETDENTEDNASEEIFVADRLKLQFIEHKVLPTCLDIFFGFPFNNFLHYVVYDMLHQIFNGSMEYGYNRQLALSVLKDGRLTNRIIEAYELNEQETAKPKGMRLGYMGHLTFIADEISKLMDHYSEVESTVRDDVDLQKWDHFYIEVLAETRERDTLPLGGDRPTAGVAYSVSEEEDDEDALVSAQDDFSRYMQHSSKAGYDDDEEEIGESSDHWMSGGGEDSDAAASFQRLRIRNDNDQEGGDGTSQWSTFPRTSLIQQQEEGEDDEYDRFSDQPVYDSKNQSEGNESAYQYQGTTSSSSKSGGFVPAIKTREEEREYKYEGDDDEEQEGEI